MSISRVAWAIGVLGALSLGSGCVLDATEATDDDDAVGYAAWDLAAEDDSSGTEDTDEGQIGDEMDAFEDGSTAEEQVKSQATEVMDPHPDPWHIDARQVEGPTNKD